MANIDRQLLIDAGIIENKTPTQQAKHQTPGKSLPVEYTAAQLLNMDFPAPNWLIPGRLTVGAALLCGPPKLGKSWWCLGMGLTAANNFDVLYLSLEDTAARLQARLRIVLDGRTAPENFYFYTEWPKLDEGGIGQLNDFLIQHPLCKLIMVDTLAKVRHKKGKNNGLYEDDYEAITGLKMVADKHSAAIVAVHHINKSKPADILETVSGTTGLTGAADTIMILGRERGAADGTLFITGRDIEEQDLAMHFDKRTCTWNVLGEAQDYRISKERQEILDVLKRAGKPLAPSEIAKELGKKDGTIRKLIFSLSDDGKVISTGYGKYIISGSTGNGNTGNASPTVTDTRDTTVTTVTLNNNNIYNDIPKGDAWEPDECNILPFTDDEIPF